MGWDTKQVTRVEISVAEHRLATFLALQRVRTQYGKDAQAEHNSAYYDMNARDIGLPN